MITQELVQFIKQQLSLDKTREEITQMLQLNDWSSGDIQEAFGHAFLNVSGVPRPKNRMGLVALIIFILAVAAIGFGIWSSMQRTNGNTRSDRVNDSEIVTGSTDAIAPVVENDTVSPQVQQSSPKDCGVSNGETDYGSDEMIRCIGQSALVCENATGRIEFAAKDNLSPRILSIVKDAGNCHFVVGYTPDTTLKFPVTNVPLAGKSLQCPLSMVKSVDYDASGQVVLGAPDKTNAGKYGAQIYYYGMSGVFAENNFNATAMRNKGCSGNYIDAFIDFQSKIRGSN